MDSLLSIFFLPAIQTVDSFNLYCRTAQNKKKHTPT